jgi:hypothetical protein
MTVSAHIVAGCPVVIDATSPLDISIHVGVHVGGVATFTVTHASVRARVHAAFVSSVSDFFAGR